MFMIAAIVSCSKESTNDNDLDLLKKAKVGATFGKVESLPVSAGLITPQIITGANNGGNRTCTEVAAAWKLAPNPFYCWDKIDYNNGAFAGAFPSGLDVTVTAGKYVSFEMDDCILIGDKYFKVGAVIVKGSNNANVYYYPDGTTGDSGLASPLNNSGNPAGLSNLTFCFVDCEQPQWIIAFKGQMTFPELINPAAVSDGIDADINDYNIGYNYYHLNQVNVYPLLHIYDLVQIGTITASDLWIDDVHYLRVVIDTENSDWGFLNSYLYVGTLAGFNAYRTPWYDDKYLVDIGSFPFQQGTMPEPCEFVIPFSSITE